MPIDNLEDRCLIQSVYPVTSNKLGALYLFLAEREPHQIISHTKMPSFDDHRTFVEGHPYKDWYILYDKQSIGQALGSFYVTYKNEIGIHIAKGQRGVGLGKAIIKYLYARYPGQELFANINPANEASIEFFKTFGFQHIQNTYKLTVPENDK